MKRPWPTGEKLPGFFARPRHPAWLARNMGAWEHLRTKREPERKDLQPRGSAR